MTTKEFQIVGMSCNHCVKSVKLELEKLNLDKSTVEIGKAKITFDENVTREDQIKKAIEDAGYKTV